MSYHYCWEGRYSIYVPLKCLEKSGKSHGIWSWATLASNVITSFFPSSAVKWPFPPSSFLFPFSLLLLSLPLLLSLFFPPFASFLLSCLLFLIVVVVVVVVMFTLLHLVEICTPTSFFWFLMIFVKLFCHVVCLGCHSVVRTCLSTCLKSSSMNSHSFASCRTLTPPTPTSRKNYEPLPRSFFSHFPLIVLLIFSQVLDSLCFTL